ncbi:hypothetical protein [Umezawaea sp.]|uniref:hypothetical protein n=1 Tax=Umezawaea sp. TaxID=1955258 RepID=UPI002ED4D6F4
MHLARIDLLLTEEPRAFTSTDVHTGRISVHGVQIDHIGVDDEDQDVLLLKVLYDVTFEEDAPEPLVAEIGFEFRTPDVRVRDAWPRSVTSDRPPERLAVTRRLEFVRHTPDCTGLLDDNVPVPDLAPAVHALGIGSGTVRWRHTGGVRPGPRRGWLVVTAPASCREVEVLATAEHELEDPLGMHPRGKPETVFIRLPHRRQSLDGLRYRIGFAVDVVGFGSRTVEQQSAVQQRLSAVLGRFADELGIAVDPTSFAGEGDGFLYYLPDVDALAAVRHLVRTVPRLLHEDNLRHDDRIRLRMAADVGPVGSAPLGFTGPTTTRFCRLVESSQIRDAMTTTDTDIAIFVSDTLNEDVVRQYGDLSCLPFERHDVVVKNYQAVGHLLTCSP